MTHIDKYKSPEYFQKYIDEQMVRIDKFKKVLDGCGESEKIKICRILCDRYKDLISAQFSNNDDLSKIRNSFKAYAEYIFVAGFSCYSEYIDFLSLQIILGIEDLSIDAPKEYADDLSQILTSHINGSNYELTGNLYEEHYYSIFADYYNGKLNFIELMDYVNKKWYSSSLGFYWFDSHLNNNDVYTGYWCYIASAIIRIKGDYNKVEDTDCFIV